MLDLVSLAGSLVAWTTLANSNFECEWILVIFFLREMDISAVQLLKYVAERELQDMIYFL